MPPRSLSLVGVAVLSLVAPRSAQVSQYTITDASHTAPGHAIGVAGLSDTGFVCGWWLGASSSGFRWSARGGRVVSLDPPDGIAWGDHNSLDVNAAGAVVGLFGTTIGGFSLTRGYRWHEGASKELFTPLGVRGMPEAINDAGWIVGHAGVRPAGTPGAVMWDADLVPSFVADLDDALDINDRNQVVGYRADLTGARTLRGFLWEEGKLVSLGTLDPRGVGDVLPRALDEHGRVVGSSEIDGVKHAFLWERDAGMRELPDLGIVRFPFDVEALDINDCGWIVGYAPGASGQTDVLWSPDGSVRELEPMVPDIGPDKRWEQLFGVLRINSSGQIAGRGLREIGVRQVLLTPAAIQAGALVPGVAGQLNTLAISGADPGRKVFLVGDRDDPFDRGYSVLPGCRSIGVSMAKPRFVAIAVADAAGRATFRWLVPRSLARLSIRLQAAQLGGCAVSNVVIADL